MKRFVTRASVFAVGLVALLLGVVVSQAQMHIGSGDPVADRQRLMKLNGANAKDLNDKLKAGNVEAMAVNAETIAINAQHIPVAVPEGLDDRQVERQGRDLGEVGGLRGGGEDAPGKGRGNPRRRPGEGPGRRSRP